MKTFFVVLTPNVLWGLAWIIFDFSNLVYVIGAVIIAFASVLGGMFLSINLEWNE